MIFISFLILRTSAAAVVGSGSVDAAAIESIDGSASDCLLLTACCIDC